MADFQSRQPTLRELYEKARRKHAVEIDWPEGVKAFLSPGAHNELQASVLRDFWPNFVPKAKLLYLGDTAKKDWHVDAATLAQVGLPYAAHDKFPDLVFWLEDRKWLVLIEAVTTHGPVSPKRRAEREDLLKGSLHHRVYVTAFNSRKEFKQHMEEIAWETDVCWQRCPIT